MLSYMQWVSKPPPFYLEIQVSWDSNCISFLNFPCNSWNLLWQGIHVINTLSSVIGCAAAFLVIVIALGGAICRWAYHHIYGCKCWAHPCCKLIMLMLGCICRERPEALLWSAGLAGRLISIISILRIIAGRLLSILRCSLHHPTRRSNPSIPLRGRCKKKT